MSDTSKIEWTDATWNPVRGCSIVSKGCTNCYAMKQAHRFAGAGHAYEGLTQMTRGGPVWTGKVRVVPDLLDQPLHWKKPRRIFVNSMSDLFHEDVTDQFIADVFGIMAATPWHTYQVLTKRPRRALYLLGAGCMGGFEDAIEECMALYTHSDLVWPIPNVWLGVSVEDQAAADERIPLLLQAPATVRWISAEPLLGPIDLVQVMVKPIFDMQGWLNWIVIGGESGPGARGCSVADIRSIVRQCRAVGIPVFVKQLGAYVVDRNDAGFDGCDPTSWPDMDPMDIEDNIHGFKDEYQGADVRVRLGNRKGGAMCEWPEDLRVREYPQCS